MKTTILAAAAALMISTSAMAEPVKLDEPLRLDAAQLDAVSAGTSFTAIGGFAGIFAMLGNTRSQVQSTFTAFWAGLPAQLGN